ncbi:MAG: hypothetical protein HC789_12280 [Microcoleus sp. CSU_2_2]|nr:hypothetical protein [Microcoleus sp. SU_5_3]NJS11087.1 hypothetical protein [Microcoleus sp. CSU_2_2]
MSLAQNNRSPFLDITIARLIFGHGNAVSLPPNNHQPSIEDVKDFLLGGERITTRPERGHGNAVSLPQNSRRETALPCPGLLHMTI